MQNKQTNPYRLRKIVQCTLLLAMAAFGPRWAQATPYATALDNTAGTISFRLNESATSISVIYTNLAAGMETNTWGPQAAGLVVTNLSVPGAFSVTAYKSAAPGYISGAALQISDDATNTVKFNSPRGVAVNQNPASPYFGRVYVANSADGSVGGRTLTDGIYLLNSDFTDAVGQGDTALTNGINVQGSTSTPYRLEVGQDDQLYIASWATGNGGIFVADPDMTAAQAVLTNVNSIGSSIIAEGSLGGGNLKLYAMDSDDTNGVNRIRLWDVGSGPLPTTYMATNMDNPSVLGIGAVTVDMAKGPDGKFYTCQRRALIPNEGGIFVVDPTVDGGIFFPTPDGLWDVVYDSRADSIGVYGEPYDLLYESGGVAISPDGNWMAVVRYSGSDTWIIPLVSGLPDLSKRRLVDTGTVTAGRDIGFDAAGNFYTVSSGDGVMRVFSPGFDTIATTSSDGTFSVTNFIPDNVVTVTGTITNAAEPGTDGQITFTRDGSDLSQPLTVSYAISGTATRGVDYNTNSISGTNTGTVTFPAFSTTVDVAIPVINDGQAELEETVIFTLIAGTNYVVGNTTPGIVYIADDGDLPTLSLSVTGSGIYELLPGRPAKLRLTSAVADQNNITAQIQVSGGAVSGVDYSEASSFGLTLLAGTTSTNFPITPIDNATIASNKTITVSLMTNANYNIGTTSVTFTLRNDDLPAAPVLFADNFDVDSSASWTVKTSNGDSDAAFAFDYSTVGIPSAPNSSGGSTKGLRLRAHLGALAAISGIGASPTGLVLPTDYRLRFDLWMNYNGPMPGGGAGSSTYFTTGLGVDQNRTNVVYASSTTLPGSTVFFSVDGDGGFGETTGDFIAHTNGVRIAASGTNIYPAGSRDNFNAYYAEFGELPAPANQLISYVNQTGLGQIGSLSFAWHDVVITKQGTNYTWTIDGLRIANLGYPFATVGNNFSVGYQDTSSSLANVIDMNFGLVDNLRVESLTITPPLITSITLISAGTEVQIDFTAAASDVPGDFTLQSTGNLATTPLADVAATISSLGGGNFRAVRSISGSEQFYRIKR